MQFALNEMGFPHEQWEQNIDVLSQSGYDGLEPNVAGDGPFWDDEETEKIASMVASAGLDVPAVSTTLHWEHSLSSPEETVRERAIEIGERVIEVADRLGAEAVLIVPAVVTEDVPYDVAYDRSLESVRHLAGVADEYDVTVAIENVWNGFLLSPLEFAAFVDDAARAGPVGAYVDVGNVRRFGYPDQWIRILGDRIERIHVKDYRTDVDTIDGFTYPLQGDLRWEAIATALTSIGYDGWITAEVPPYESRGERMPGQVLENLKAVFE